MKRRLLSPGLFVFILIVVGMTKGVSQTPYRQYSNNGVELNFSNIEDVYFRAYLLYNLSQDDRFILTAEEDNGIFYIGSSNESLDEGFFDTFEDVYNLSYTDFQILSKLEITDLYPVWKSRVDPRFFTSIMMDITLHWSRSYNEHCIDAAPLCFPRYSLEATMTDQTADEENMDDGCISGQSYAPSWYYLKILDPGPFSFYMIGSDPNNNSTSRDIDFCLWGPYTAEQIFSGYSCTHLTSDKIIDCCYSPSYLENVYLGYPEGEHQHDAVHGTVNYHVPQTGEYYVLMITNYSRQPCIININEDSGSGTTDCALLPPPIVDNDGPYCVGESIQLTAIGEVGASYYWTGPNGYRSRYQNPIRTNCTMDMAGYYVCTITKNSLTGLDSTLVEIYPQPIACFTASATTVCVGSPVDFNSTSTTNPSGYAIPTCNWDFGDGQTASGTTQSHTFNQSGIFTVTLSVATEGGYCTDEISQIITVNINPPVVSNDGPYCVGETIHLSATGEAGASYRWTGPNGWTSNYQNPNRTNCTMAMAGTYTCTITKNGQTACSTTVVTIYNTESEQYNVTECDTYTWHGTSYTQSGNYVYTTTTEHGCPRTETLHLTINHSETEEYTVIECDSYTWHGISYTQSGNYVYNTTTAQGCPRTETLHLTINHSETEEYNVTECDSYTWHGTNYTQSGNYVFNTSTAQGCPKTEILNLTINHSENEELTYNACESYTWHGTTYTTSGNYTYNTETALGCPRTETLHLTISDVIHTEFSVQACESYTWNGTPYNSSGNYTQQFTSIQNCDSIVTLHLTIGDAIQNEFSEQACDTYTWNGTTYNTSGNYTQKFTTPQGCDSIVTLHLTINHSETVYFAENACDAFIWHGSNYTQSGTYTFNTITAAGCDRLETLHLTISDAIQTEFSKQACESYTWNGQTYNTSGDYTQQFASVQGCDSIVTLHLTISDIETESFTVTECDMYTWHGTTYTESGVYTFETITPEGCQRVETLYLTINPSETEDFTMTAVESYTWHGTTYTESGDYTYETTTAQGCPRIETLHLTITHGQEFYTIIASAGPNGRIQPEGEVHVEPGGLISFTITPDPGCAISQVIIDGVEYAPIETVAFSNVHGDHTVQALFWGVGVDEQLNPMLRIYPNPAKDKLNIESLNMKRVSVFNLLGVQMGSMDVNGDCAVVGMDEFPQGIYILKVEYDNGRVGYSQFVVVR